LKQAMFSYSESRPESTWLAAKKGSRSATYQGAGPRNIAWGQHEIQN
jgi:hypothetical protein